MYIWSRRRHLYQPLADLYPFPIYSRYPFPAYSRSRSLRGTSSFLKLTSRSWQQSSKRKTPCDRRVNVLSTNFINGWGPCDQPKLDQFMKFPPTYLTVTSSVFFAGVRQKDGSEYEPDTLTTYQRGIDRYIFVRTTTNFPSAAIKNSQIRVRLWKLNVQN